MATATIRVSFQPELLQQLDSFVEAKTRTRADIIVEATKMYIARKQNWQNIFLSGDRLASENNLSESDVMNEIKAYRREK
jgi:metal-responsive CopG/Arc/MetJ family transcriptional regulator